MLLATMSLQNIYKKRTNASNDLVVFYPVVGLMNLIVMDFAQKHIISFLQGTPNGIGWC